MEFTTEQKVFYIIYKSKSISTKTIITTYQKIFNDEKIPDKQIIGAITRLKAKKVINGTGAFKNRVYKINPIDPNTKSFTLYTKAKEIEKQFIPLPTEKPKQYKEEKSKQPDPNALSYSDIGKSIISHNNDLKRKIYKLEEDLKKQEDHCNCLQKRVSELNKVIEKLNSTIAKLNKEPEQKNGTFKLEEIARFK